MIQYLRESKVRKALGDWRNRSTDQYINNVSLKIKAKLSRINSDTHSQLHQICSPQKMLIKRISLRRCCYLCTLHLGAKLHVHTNHFCAVPNCNPPYQNEKL